MPKITARDLATADLIKKGVPTPTDFVPLLEFFSGLFFLREVAMGVGVRAIQFFEEEMDSSLDPGQTEADVKMDLALCIAHATNALVALDLLPAESLQALAEAGA